MTHADGVLEQCLLECWDLVPIGPDGMDVM